MQDNGSRAARIASVVAATGVALACGTNYAYSAWGPDFAKHMHLSATQSNVIGAAGNMGMYAMGIPSGLLNDNYNPRWAILVGAISLACGYFPIHTAFDKGPGSMSVGAISFCSFLTGLGSCCAFSAAIKVSTVNWPAHRGTATAFPLSGFGLSAFFFATIGNLAFKNNTSGLLLLLAVGTAALMIVSFPFIRILPSGQEYAAVASDDDGSPASHSGRRRRSSKPLEEPMDLHQDITGLRLLPQSEFWQLFGSLCLLAGVGLMTINNIGNDAAALWHAYDPTASHSFIQSREQMHVSILSLGSFLGRLGSGIGSDFLIKRLHASRYWCLVVSSIVFGVAQLFALTITNPNFLFLVSSLTGLGYGALFGVFPALVADAFGVKGLGLNWGFMIFAPVVSSNIYNICYGRILDGNSDSATDGECFKGLVCYRDAYWITLASSMAALLLALYCIRQEKLKRLAVLRESARDA